MASRWGRPPKFEQWATRSNWWFSWFLFRLFWFSWHNFHESGPLTLIFYQSAVLLCATHPPNMKVNGHLVFEIELTKDRDPGSLHPHYPTCRLPDVISPEIRKIRKPPVSKSWSGRNTNAPFEFIFYHSVELMCATTPENISSIRHLVIEISTLQNSTIRAPNPTWDDCHAQSQMKGDRGGNPDQNQKLAVSRSSIGVARKDGCFEM